MRTREETCRGRKHVVLTHQEQVWRPLIEGRAHGLASSARATPLSPPPLHRVFNQRVLNPLRITPLGRADLGLGLAAAESSVQLALPCPTLLQILFHARTHACAYMHTRTRA